MEYTVSEVKFILNHWGIDLTEQYIRDLLREGVIKGHIRSRKKGWMINEKDLQKYLESRCPVARDFGIQDYRIQYA
ncbi:hypothetical protein AAGG74_23375 [Bacillus mexicanus]|uniref:hypothetical protein n=1 Tax=Bacillus mexicanus TaxID=2834415 RepID=UPI003D206DD9